MRAMGPADWSFLVTLCDPDVQEMYVKRGTPGSPFSRLHIAMRNALDSYLTKYIDSDWRGEGI